MSDGFSLLWVDQQQMYQSWPQCEKVPFCNFRVWNLLDSKSALKCPILSESCIICILLVKSHYYTITNTLVLLATLCLVGSE